MKKNPKKIGIGTLLTVLLLLLIVGCISYFKLSGFERTLKQIVLSETDSLYILNVEDASVNFITHRFSFEGVSIVRNKSVSGKGVREVRIPSFHLHFGSLTSMLALHKLEIQRLVVDEPVFELDTDNNGNGPGADKRRPQFSQQIVKLYPAIQAILANFEIGSIVVRRASLDFTKESKSALKLDFIDLLIESWNISNLTPKSQLRLGIDRQNLKMGKVSVDFSSIEYNWQRRHLMLSDLNVTAIDSLTGSKVDLQCESVILYHLDYDDLYRNERFTLRRAEVNNPVISARVTTQAKHDKNSDPIIITRILKNVIGECSIDSTVINNAQLQLSIRKATDSVNLHLEKVDVMVHTFKVIKDSVNFQLGELDIKLNETALALPHNRSVTLEKIFFDKDRNLTISNVKLMHQGNSQPIATIEKLKAKNFNLLSFLFHKEFDAKDIVIENGDIHLTPGNQHQNHEQRKGPLTVVSINHIALKNSSIHLSTQDQRFSLTGVSGTASGIHYDSVNHLKYSLHRLQFQTGLYVNKKQQITGRIKNTSFDGNFLRTEGIILTKDSLSIIIDNVSAKSHSRNFLDYGHWEKVTVGSAKIHGKIPTLQPVSKPDHNSKTETKIDTISLRHLEAAIVGRNTIQLNGKNINLYDLSVNGDTSSVKSLEGMLSNIVMKSPTFELDAEKGTVNYPSHFSMNKINVKTANEKLMVDKLNARTIVDLWEGWRIANVTARGIRVSRPAIPNSGGPEKALLVSDSIQLRNVILDKNLPMVHEVEVFNPVISAPDKTTGDQKKDKSDRSIQWPEHVIVHPGKFYLKNGTSVTFGRWNANLKTKSIHCDHLNMESTKSLIDIHSLSINKDQTSIDSFLFKSNKMWYDNLKVEESEINAGVYGISVAGITFDSLLSANTFRNVDVKIKNFDMNVRRDKTLADPPFRVKPVTLDGLIPIPENIQINTIHILDGHLRYDEVSDQTGHEGWIELQKISARAAFDKHSNFMSLHATNSIYNNGRVELNYQTLDTSSFKLDIRATGLDLVHFNKIVVPLKALEIKSGYVEDYNLSITADDDNAVGDANITYSDLHLIIFKRSEPEKKSIGSELLTLMADGVILRHKKENAYKEVSHSRVKHKSVFHYWVTSSIHGALGAIRKGKKQKGAATGDSSSGVP